MIDVYEWIGYLGSVLVAWSITLQNLHRLRQMNLLGASVFTVYGVLVEAWPVALVNGFIAVVNVWNLSQWQRQGPEAFELVSFERGHPFLERFLGHFQSDIASAFPHLETITVNSLPDDAICEFVYRDMVPSGLFVYRNVSAQEREIYLDYVTPQHRDYKTAEFLYACLNERFVSSGVQRLRARSSQDEHREYLRKMGFENVAGQKDEFVLELSGVTST